MLRLDGVTCTLRFSAPETDAGYSHALDGEKMKTKLPVYLYMCVLSDVGIVKEAPYYGISRKLKLDEEKEGGDEQKKEGEEEDETMIFDIVDAKFAVYNSLFEGAGGTSSFPSITAMTTTTTTTTTATITAGPKPKYVLVCVSINPASTSSTTTDTSSIPKLLHDSLIEKVKAAVPPALTTQSCLYHWAGEDAQPDMHPFIDIGVSGEWMVMVLLGDEEGKTLSREHVCSLVEGWVGDCARGIVGAERGGKVGFGVWEGEVLMG